MAIANHAVEFFQARLLCEDHAALTECVLEAKIQDTSAPLIIST